MMGSPRALVAGGLFGDGSDLHRFHTDGIVFGGFFVCLQGDGDDAFL